MNLAIETVLIPQDEIEQKIKELAADISRIYQNEEIILLSVLKGSIVFLVDLMKQLTLDVEIGFLYLSSYRGETEAQGAVKEYELPFPAIENRNVILVEDIFDTGASLNYAKKRCMELHPKSLRTCVLLKKEEVQMQEPCTIDFLGFTIPDKFVVGYGLDYREKYRHLPYIAVPRLGNH